MNPAIVTLAATTSAAPAFGRGAATPLGPFPPDNHTLLLHPFDEGEVDLVPDSGPHEYDGGLNGAEFGFNATATPPAVSRVGVAFPDMP